MNGHTGDLLILLLALVGVAGAIRNRMKRSRNAHVPAAPAVTRSPRALARAAARTAREATATAGAFAASAAPVAATAPRSVPAPGKAVRRAPAAIASAEPAAAFPVLDLTLPGADQPASFGGVRTSAPVFRGIAPGSRAWGRQAIVAMEILGPPVSLRSGATLGAPHAF